jgi:hypothetical protein
MSQYLHGILNFYTYNNCQKCPLFPESIAEVAWLHHNPKCILRSAFLLIHESSSPNFCADCVNRFLPLSDKWRPCISSFLLHSNVF